MRIGRKLGQSGDTIVEVLIVLAVLGLSMSIAYATANTSLQKSRNAQEHSQALGILNSQVELMRSAFAQKQGSAIETQAGTGPFCLSPSGSTVAITALANSGVNKFDENLASDKLGNAITYPGPCIQDTLYNISIVGRGNSVYDFRVRWEGEGQLGRQQEELTYKIGNVVPVAGGGYTDPELPPPPPFSGALNVSVQAIPPAANNTTPSCASPATQLKGGTTVGLTDNTTGTFVGNKSTGANSLAVFTGIQQGDTFTANASRSGYGVCPGTSTAVATTTTPVPVISMKIYPVCSTSFITNYGWVWGNRRADLDGYYGTIPPVSGAYPTAYSYIYTSNVYVPGGTFVYAWAGINNGTDAYMAGQGYLYYYLWEVSWAPVSVTPYNYCPS